MNVTGVAVLVISSMMLTSKMPTTEEITHTASVYASEASTSYSDKVEIQAYESQTNSVSLSWESSENADGYYVFGYDRENDTYQMLDRVHETTYTADSLEAGHEYSFAVRTYNDTGIGQYSDTFSTVTKPQGQTRIEKAEISEGIIDLEWTPTKCTGYLVYIYNRNEDKWVNIAKLKGSDHTSHRFDINKKGRKGRTISDVFEENNPLFGYRFRIVPYAQDEDRHHIFHGMKYTQLEYNALIDMEYLSEKNAQGLRNLATAERTSKDTQRSFTYYLTTTNDAGHTSVGSYIAGMTDADLRAIKDFEKKYFKDEWTDEQKLLFTANWINKFVTYDYEYKISKVAPGYAERIFRYRMGQCDAYNGALVEMALYLGYKGFYLHWWDSASGGHNHARAYAVLNGRTYSFEDGNAGKSGEDWFWFCQPDDDALLHPQNAEIIESDEILDVSDIPITEIEIEDIPEELLGREEESEYEESFDEDFDDDELEEEEETEEEDAADDTAESDETAEETADEAVEAQSEEDTADAESDDTASEDVSETSVTENEEETSEETEQTTTTPSHDNYAPPQTTPPPTEEPTVTSPPPSEESPEPSGSEAPAETGPSEPPAESAPPETAPAETAPPETGAPAPESGEAPTPDGAPNE